MRDYRQLFSLDGKRALVTGAGREVGIGAAIAKGLGDFGAEVALHDRAASECGARVRDAIRSGGVRCNFFAQDLSEIGSGKDLIDRVETEFGAIDILVINAAVESRTGLDRITPEEVELQINVNFRANFDMLQEILPRMASRGWGRVVNVGSINQRAPKPIVTIYAATKAAQHNMIQSLAREFAPRGVCLNTVAPGLVDTHPDRRQGDPDACKEWDDYVRQLNWMGRAGSPDEIVGAAVFLSSQACSFMTGEAVFPTGGF